MSNKVKVPGGAFYLGDGLTVDQTTRTVSAGGGGSSVPTTGAVTTLHINVTAVNVETMEATFTADKTPMEMLQASANGPIWCVVSFAAGTMAEEAISLGVPPAWYGGTPTFGEAIAAVHKDDGNNKILYAVSSGFPDTWFLDLSVFKR